MKNPQQGPPPAEFVTLMKKGGIRSLIDIIILIIAAVFMVSTAFF